MTTLRDYQLRACASARVAWVDHKRVLLVLATGLGKTEIFTSLADRWTKGRVLVVAPRIQLVSQIAKKILRVTGEAPGIEQSTLRSEESLYLRSRFVVGSKQTLCGGRYRRLKDIGLVVVDEAHDGLTKPVRDMLLWFEQNNEAVSLGLTATPRAGKMGFIWQSNPFQMDIAQGISQGWLCPPRAQCVQLANLDLSSIAPTGGKDFSEAKLAEVMGQDRVVFEVADVTARESAGLKTVVFCTHVKDARGVAERLQDVYGLRADWVCGDQRLCSKERRRDVLRSFVADPDGVQIVCNVGVLTTGWDFPGLQHIVNARPTMSWPLFVQIFGRGTRALPGVVDFEGSTAEARRLAIASSAKPFFKFTDLRDVALNHKLVSVVDVLGSGDSAAVRRRAAGSLSDGPRDVDEALVKARRDQEEAEAAAERTRRNRYGARADYNVVAVDPFNPYDVAKSKKAKKESHGPVMLFGKHRRKPLKFIPSDYLRWFLNNVELRPKQAWLGDAVRAELESRKARSPVRGERFA